MKSPRQSAAESFWDNSVRIDHIIWLAANSSDTQNALKNFLEYEAEAVEKLLGRRPPEAGKDFDEYLTDLHNDGKSGYLVEAVTPILQKGGIYTWGYTTSKWFYFEVLDEAAVMKAMEEWVDTMRPENVLP